MEKKNNKTPLKIEYKTVQTRAIANPSLWGPALWFTLHNGAAQYPIKPNDFWKEKMKAFIHGLSVMIPCEKCSVHASSFISTKSPDELNEIVSSRKTLFKFFFEFHNFVNIRIGKPPLNYEEIVDKYMNPTDVEFITYH